MRERPDDLAMKVRELCLTYLRLPTEYATEDGLPVLTFDPPLTSGEQATYNLLLGMARSGMTSVSPADFGVIRANLQTLRDLRQLGRNAFLAQTTAQKERQLYDALVADTIIWLAVLRE